MQSNRVFSKLGWAFFGLLIFIVPECAMAQLPRDVQDMFESIMDDLDDDLRKKFAQAIEDDTATVEFTPEQFLRFRDDPINPFEGLDRLDVKPNGTNIALKFELPSLRNRRIDPNERQSTSLLNSLTPAVSGVVPSSVAIMSGKRQVALGTVVDADGLIATKLSQVAKRKYLKVVTSDARDYNAKIVFSDDENDVAFLKVKKRLQPIKWTSEETAPGAFLLMPAPRGKAFAIGTYSVVSRSTQTGKQAKLGVNPDEVPGGIKIAQVTPGEPSYKAGLRDGDVIISMDGVAIRTVGELVNAIRKKGPGRKIRIIYLRDGRRVQTVATLGSLDIPDEQAQRFKMMNRLGAIPSKRADNFPSVFQHDAPLFPEQCGGPVVDLQGNVVGMNIARNGRAATYAIPLPHLQQLVKKFVRRSVADRKEFELALPQ